MISPIWLIAGREFRTYAATASFWVALAVGPVLMGAGLLLAGGQAHRPAPAETLTLTVGPHGTEARFSRNFPLSEASRAELVRVLDRNGAPGPVHVATAAKPPIDAAGLSRFALVMMLWMALTGSLGMLLQAVVRERSNRALESLLAAARPADIVLGKLAGVGAVSMLVVGAWLGSSAALGALSPASGAVATLLHGLAEPATLLRAGLIYLLAFAFYGLTTVAVGAMARDNADAQNLARPMFALLLVVFFTAMAAVGGSAQSLAWLTYVPPFTPFMLLVAPPSPVAEMIAVVLLTLATVAAGVFAAHCLRLDHISASVRRAIPSVRKS